MDLIAILRDKIDTLDEGDYMLGLRAVLLHIETAYRHFLRGQNDGDEQAFTDAIYRANHAFEGILKEAYRVLAGKDPAGTRPYDIESYFEENSIFRDRVLNQFKRYRTEWRNPSTHDYRLFFDESEAFLGIVSVTTFACLLLDQISEQIAFIKSKANAESQREEIQHRIPPPDADLVSYLVQAIQEFALYYQPVFGKTEVQVIGALHGFLAVALPDVQVTIEPLLGPTGQILRPDLLAQRRDEIVVLEVKRRFSRQDCQRALAQVKMYMTLGNVKNGILFFLPDKAGELVVEEHVVEEIGGRMVVLRPKLKQEAQPAHSADRPSAASRPPACG
ncbi:MAG: hypothetical protein QXS54_08325 [Candidatus Methanomethylicaceae archaeon]